MKNKERKKIIRKACDEMIIREWTIIPRVTASETFKTCCPLGAVMVFYSLTWEALELKLECSSEWIDFFVCGFDKFIDKFDNLDPSDPDAKKKAYRMGKRFRKEFLR